jgi:hypothetical protein
MSFLVAKILTFIIQDRINITLCVLLVAAHLLTSHVHLIRRGTVEVKETSP